MRKSRISPEQQDKLIEHFVGGTTARCGAEIVRVHRNSGDKMNCIGKKTEFSCSVVKAILPIMRCHAKKGEKITYGNLVDCQIEGGKIRNVLNAIPIILGDPLSLMNVFTIDVTSNPKFFPSILVVNKITKKPSEKFYLAHGDCLKDKESELMDILKNTSDQDWQKIIDESVNLNHHDEKYMYRRRDHFFEF